MPLVSMLMIHSNESIKLTKDRRIRRNPENESYCLKLKLKLLPAKCRLR